MDGFDLRAESDVPILLVTARSTEDDKAAGAGRPGVALRRRAGKGAPGSDAIRTVGDLEIDAARFEVRVARRPVVLAAKGLASARQIVTGHGGTIAVDSRQGEGTVVTITLPGPWLTEPSPTRGAGMSRPARPSPGECARHFTMSAERQEDHASDGPSAGRQCAVDVRTAGQ